MNKHYSERFYLWSIKSDILSNNIITTRKPTVVQIVSLLFSQTCIVITFSQHKIKAYLSRAKLLDCTAIANTPHVLCQFIGHLLMFIEGALIAIRRLCTQLSSKEIMAKDHDWELQTASILWILVLFFGISCSDATKTCKLFFFIVHNLNRRQNDSLLLH